MYKIINSFLDTDLYTFSLCYVYLLKFPRAEAEYTFIDRNNTVYPKGFDKLIGEQLKMMEYVNIQNDELSFLSEKCYYYPKWYLTFLKGYRFDSKEVTVKQDKEGHLEIKIKGLLWRTVFWEQPILAIVSELYHNEMHEPLYKMNYEFEKSYDKAINLLNSGVNFSEFGTRRRFSFMHQDIVLSSFKKAIKDTPFAPGKLTGTSNVYFAQKYDLTPIGTMAHQYISMIGAFYGPIEANNIAMNTWEEVYNGSLGIYLYDTYTRKVFLNNFSEKKCKVI